MGHLGFTHAEGGDAKDCHPLKGGHERFYPVSRGGGGRAEKVVNPIFSYSVDSLYLESWMLIEGGGEHETFCPVLRGGYRML